MKFAFSGDDRSRSQQWFAKGLKKVMTAHGHQFIEDPDHARLVMNVADVGNPRPFRRKAKATFVVSIVSTGDVPKDPLQAGYPLLVRTLSNLLIYLVERDSFIDTHFVTLEQGAYTLAPDPDDDRFFERVYERLTPLASSQLVIDNEYRTDLPHRLWEGDPLTRQLQEAGGRLDALNLLPAPFPIHELLSPRDLRHVHRLYGIGGLSYGNLSIRRDAASFWMSASGVNKADLRVVGRDILLVTGYDPERNTMILSVPPSVEPRRVSVDAIEHWMIYTEHPPVGAIVHIHAWMEGILSTEVNYPCGTLELATSVAELVRRAPDPGHAVIGLKNHGLTITGPSLDDIFDRIEGKVKRQVPLT
ncbi:MAG: class II aldolase/adducin family protein [Armatimonadetes bacterium]|nr:class II aldolase/adducin family protein [Armatimonadota bacterium]